MLPPRKGTGSRECPGRDGLGWHINLPHFIDEETDQRGTWRTQCHPGAKPGAPALVLPCPCPGAQTARRGPGGGGAPQCPVPCCQSIRASTGVTELRPWLLRRCLRWRVPPTSSSNHLGDRGACGGHRGLGQVPCPPLTGLRWDWGSPPLGPQCQHVSSGGGWSPTPRAFWGL